MAEVQETLYFHGVFDFGAGTRDFAAWLGLVPRQHSSGGKQRLGRTSKMGQRDIRRLLIIGAMGVIRWTIRMGVLAQKSKTLGKCSVSYATAISVPRPSFG